MKGNSTVSLTIQLKGTAGAALKKIGIEQVESAKKVNATWGMVATGQAKFVQVAKSGTVAVKQTAQAGEQYLRTNRMLEGVLRQQSIQTKLHSQLLKQQVSSAQQIAQWMQKVEQSGRRTNEHTKSTVSLWQKGAALTAGTVAGGMVVSGAMQQPRTYDQQLTYIAATATGGQGMAPAQRLSKRSTLNDYVKYAVRNGGGTREDTATALNDLIASGKYDLSTVKDPLAIASKTAFATGATASDSANVTVSMANFRVSDLQRGHDIAVRGGQLGSFEYRDMAKWLPQQMAAAQGAGYSGDAGLIKLVTMNQLAKTTAGTSDEAGNNVVNLLAKLSSREFSDSVSKAVTVRAGDPTISTGKGKKKKEVFDWSTYAIQQRNQGVYGVDAFIKIMERELSGNKQYQRLQSQIGSAKTPEAKKAILNDMSNIAAGSAMGEFIADRQALMAALAVKYNKDKGAEIEKQLQNAGGTVDADSAMVRQTEWAKDIALNQEKLFAQSKAYDSISETLGNFKENLVKVAGQHEGLAAAGYGATVALTAAAGAAGMYAVAGRLGGAPGGIAGRVAGAAGRAGGYGLAVTGAGAAGYGIGSLARWGYMKTEVGQKADNALGSGITHLLAAFGNDEAQQTIESNKKYEKMINQQGEMINLLKGVNQGLNNMPAPIINLPATPLMAAMTNQANQDAKRHATIPFKPY